VQAKCIQEIFSCVILCYNMQLRPGNGFTTATNVVVVVIVVVAGVLVVIKLW